MKPLREVRGGSPSSTARTSTPDQIIPKQFPEAHRAHRYGQFLFYDWRLDERTAPATGFELNRREFRGASILPRWAATSAADPPRGTAASGPLKDYGIRRVIAPSFGDIFSNQCGKIGMSRYPLVGRRGSERLMRGA
jgi:3-isopropylmalate/(R)-2-methylmalate dehydratase small subunit